MASELRHLECPVCLELFTSSERIPKELCCHHSICLPCVRTLIQHKQIRCPMCRHVEPLTDANQLFTHHVVLAMVQEHEREDQQQDQKAIKDDLGEAFDRISQYKSTMGRKILLVDENNAKLRKSAAKAKREAKAKFESCIIMLQDRMNQLLEEIETAEKHFKGQVKKAQADYDQAAQLQNEHEKLVEKEKVSTEEYDKFMRSEAVIKALSEKEDQPYQELKVSFDQSPDIEDVIKKFGQLQVPNVTPSDGVPLDFTQLIHIRTIGARGSMPGQFINPWGVAVRPTGTILVADAGNDRVQELDAEGSVVRVIGSEGNQDGSFSFPIDVVTNASGNIFVTDRCNHRIQVFEHEGKYVKQFGQEGSGQGKFQYPNGVAIDHHHKLLYVADQRNNRIQVFDLDGNHKKVIGHDTELKTPYYVCLHGDRLYVSDIGYHHIVVYSTNGKKIQVIGKHGSRPGEFDCPYGITADPHGRIFVCDCRNNRIQILDGDSGHVVQVFGSKGSGPGQYNRPMGVALTPSGQLVITENVGHRLQIFDFK